MSNDSTALQHRSTPPFYINPASLIGNCPHIDLDDQLTCNRIYKYVDDELARKVANCWVTAGQSMPESAIESMVTALKEQHFLAGVVIELQRIIMMQKQTWDTLAESDPRYAKFAEQMNKSIRDTLRMDT